MTLSFCNVFPASLENIASNPLHQHSVFHVKALQTFGEEIAMSIIPFDPVRAHARRLLRYAAALALIVLTTALLIIAHRLIQSFLSQLSALLNGFTG